MCEIARQVLAELYLIMFSSAARAGGLGASPQKTSISKIQKRSFYPREYPIRGP